MRNDGGDWLGAVWPIAATLLVSRQDEARRASSTEGLRGGRSRRGSYQRGREVEFEYRARTTWATSLQRVEPYGVLYDIRAFLVAPTDWADDPRLLRLDQVRDAWVLAETFERDPQFDLQSYAERSFGTFQENPVEVVCSVPHSSEFGPHREIMESMNNGRRNHRCGS